MTRFYPAAHPRTLDRDLYNLYVNQRNFQTQIRMTLHTDFFHTNFLPFTMDHLRSDLPRVLKSKCFNEDNLPFDKEVQNTEIGHLFEHILLEYLCTIKISSGARKAVFRGITSWNWKKDTKGTYHITLYINPKDLCFFDEAFNKTLRLFNKILKNRVLN